MSKETDFTALAQSSLWKKHDFANLWCGQIISSIGTQTSQLAISLVALALSHSPLQAGLVGACEYAPYVVLALPAGALIDRWDRKLMLIICNAGRGLCMASLALLLILRSLTITSLALTSLLDGIFFVFSNIGYVASLPHVVTSRQLSSAAAQFDAIGKISPLFGSALGGKLYSVQKFLPFVVDALSYALAIVSLFLIRVQFQDETVAKPYTLHAEVKEGLLWFWRQPVLRLIALFDGGTIGIIAAISPLVITIQAQLQQASPTTIGMILACGGIGTSLGLTCAQRIKQRLSYSQAIVAIGWSWVLLWFFYALAPNFIVLGMLTLSIWFLVPTYNAVQMAYRLSITPDRLQGRVNSIHRMSGFSCKLMALPLAGALIQIVGAKLTIMLIACWFVLIVLGAVVNPHLYQCGMEQERIRPFKERSARP